MEIAKLTSKGQLTLPIEIRKHLGLDTGDKVAFVFKNGEYVMIKTDRLNYFPNSVSIDGAIASMEFEGFEITPEMKAAAIDVVSGKISYDEQMARILNKYKKVSQNG